MRAKRRSTKKVLNKEQLEQLHTKQLLARQRYFYRFWDDDGNFNVNREERGWDHYVIYEGTAGDAERERSWIKELLAEREHVPNKEEARQNRVAAKKSVGKRKGKKDR